jgi:hypothetical protein
MQREKIEQAHIEQLLRTVGAAVYTIGTRRRKGDHQGTRQTPGLPDVLAFLPRHGESSARVLLFVEAKAAGGRLRPEQRVFREQCLDADVAHVVGGYDAVVAWLVARGRLRADSVPHYRQPVTLPD